MEFFSELGQYSGHDHKGEGLPAKSEGACPWTKLIEDKRSQEGVDMEEKFFGRRRQREDWVIVTVRFPVYLAYERVAFSICKLNPPL